MLVIDVSVGVMSGDFVIVGMIWEFGCMVVIVVNKWDLFDEEVREWFDEIWECFDEIFYCLFRVNIFCEMGRGIDCLLLVIDEVFECFCISFGMSEVNWFFEMVMCRY